ncbi:LysE family translocator [Psychrobium sp. 1_MG-2023]|uniref:LysE family translocator n=1 Tax=Psychrobium sp. 1_MG-2023 TaxID=3062624 RepID=UPI0027350E2C|nr:LysE family translocator [Psychrobium sp. 1_MG-2023]MDP2562945.1 LysE family translocator [Psychrobium sp. 1_MG-2023]
MSIEVWISFIAASMILCFSPGPTVFLVMGQALEYGKKSVTPLVAGTLSGDVIAMSFSFVGMGALLATSATLFTILKWAGALYLIYLGIKAFRTKVSVAEVAPKQMQKGSVYFNALVVTALNPKGIIFFMAFFPLFINANAPFLPQMLIMAVTFLAVSTASVSFYATFSGILRSKVSSVKFQNGFNKVSGGMLVGAGAITATIQK